MLLVFIKLTLSVSLDTELYTNLLETNALESNEYSYHQVGRSQNLIFENCTFRRCTSLGKLFDLEAGGAICSFECFLNISYCYFTENIAIYASCICCYGGNLTILNSTFSNSKSFNDVGAIWSMGSSYLSEGSSLNIQFSKFINNTAGRYHGALSSNLTNPIIISCEFENNRAEKAVGACAIITINGARIENTTFINNTSGDEYNKMTCPCLFLQSNHEKSYQQVILQKCYFSKNIGRDNKKHAIAIYGSINVRFDECICFDGNSYDFSEGSEQQFESSSINFNIDSIDKCACMLPTASYYFSKSSFFSSTEKFSDSYKFSKSSKFSESDDFSHSVQFTKSPYFSSSTRFSSSSVFSQESSFKQSIFFTNSEGFSSSSVLSQELSFKQSIFFTNSEGFSSSSVFSQEPSLKQSIFFTNSEDSSENYSFSCSESDSESENTLNENIISSDTNSGSESLESESYISTDSNSNSESELQSENDNSISSDSELPKDDSFISTESQSDEDSTSNSDSSDSENYSESEDQSDSQSDTESDPDSSNSENEITSPPEESEKNDKKKNLPDFSMGALGGGLGLLLLLIILIIICCCCKKKGGGCCARRKEKEVIKNTIEQPIILTVPRVSEYDDSFINYINPEYDNELYNKA